MVRVGSWIEVLILANFILSSRLENGQVYLDKSGQRMVFYYGTEQECQVSFSIFICFKGPEAGIFFSFYPSINKPGPGLRD